MSAHTPGPWAAGERLTGGCVEVTANRETMQVARVNGRPHEQEANAALIAAAPDLLAALERSLLWPVAAGLNIEWSVEPEWMSQARAAIAKARGGK